MLQPGVSFRVIVAFLLAHKTSTTPYVRASQVRVRDRLGNFATRNFRRSALSRICDEFSTSAVLT